MWARSILALAFALFAALATRFFTANDPSNRYIPKNLDLLTLTSHDLSDLLQNGSVSSVKLVQEYYRRILRDDRAGFQLHSIISLAPLDKTLAVARERDEERHAAGQYGDGSGLGHADNLRRYSRYPLNAFIVNKAEEAGAITIAKAHLVELAGFRPSFGLLSRTGILSTTASFDTPSILTKSAVNVAQWLNVLAQPDDRDPITVEAHKNRSPSYIEGLHQDWKRWRIGVLDRGAFWNASRAIFVTPKQDLQKLAECNDALVKMEALGATVVDDVPYPLAAESGQVLDTYSARLCHDDQKFLESALASNLTASKLDANLVLLEHYSREVNTEAILDKYNLDFVVFPGFTWMNVYNALSGTAVLFTEQLER
ncbi:hypothetical protein QQZ08_003537 [Neonectria magnoliae]|uniref:Amidase domain-containing protein n=1 Tax=Neonectria magnoliae TaxID=2732573 RepID=A0ABR1I8N1_9HYPO